MKMETGNETRLIQRIGHTDYRRICLTGESLKTRTKSSNPFIIEKLNTKKAQLNHCAFLMPFYFTFTVRYPLLFPDLSVAFTLIAVPFFFGLIFIL